MLMKSTIIGTKKETSMKKIVEIDSREGFELLLSRA